MKFKKASALLIAFVLLAALTVIRTTRNPSRDILVFRLTG